MPMAIVYEQLIGAALSCCYSLVLIGILTRLRTTPDVDYERCPGSVRLNSKVTTR
jgi:hypothetical protein